jgi:hypothetical protein
MNAILIMPPKFLAVFSNRENTRRHSFSQREQTAPDENPPIGIVLCTDKSEAVVRYALPEGNTQIFTSRYKLHLPTEEELAAELTRNTPTPQSPLGAKQIVIPMTRSQYDEIWHDTERLRALGAVPK